MSADSHFLSYLLIYSSFDFDFDYLFLTENFDLTHFPNFSDQPLQVQPTLSIFSSQISNYQTLQQPHHHYVPELLLFCNQTMTHQFGWKKNGSLDSTHPNLRFRLISFPLKWDLLRCRCLKEFLILTDYERMKQAVSQKELSSV